MDMCVAGMPICIDSAQKEWFDSLYRPYERQDDRPSVMNIRTVMLDEIPFLAKSSSWVPFSAMPSSVNTRICWAFWIVVRRWAITKVVRFLAKCSKES